MRAALRARSRPIEECGVRTATVVSPHPDDETFGCGAAIAQMTAEGASVRVVFLTDGAASHVGHATVPPARLAAMREAEAREAAFRLGLAGSALSFLGIPDGTLDRLADADRLRIAQSLGSHASAGADAVIVPLARDGSTEHDAAHSMVVSAIAGAVPRPRVLEYPVWAWWSPLRLMGPLFSRRRIWRVGAREAHAMKARAAASYASQLEPLAPDPAPALPEGFAAMFLCGEEFLFER
jgi:LmbE family N-acetylglucosaminyl deacetylase